MSYNYYNKDFFTKNRKLALKEYDDNGNLIEERELEDNDLAIFISAAMHYCEHLKIARYKHLSQFTKDELQLIEKCIYNMALYSNNDFRALITDEDVEYYKYILSLPKEKIDFALNLSDSQGQGLCVSMQSIYSRKRFSFNEALKFIDERPGIYYTVTNAGKRRWDFVDKPTLKQYRYQLKHNGERTVFLSFKDWKEYIVKESDLID